MTVSPEGPTGGRRKAHADLNLVPYIDLLTCMVAFLLITAVWTQLARLEVRQRGQSEDEGIEKPSAKIAVLVHPDGFALLVNGEQRPLPRRAVTGYDFAGLTAALAQLKRTYPDKTDVQVASEDGIPFDPLLATMDASIAAGFPDVSLSEAAPGGS
jgi:biopolymer transport protein ExbD